MVSCLFARKIYTGELLDECLQSVGYDRLAGRMAACSAGIQAKRWQLRMATGYRPDQITIPKRFHELTTWKGKTDPAYLDALLTAYARAITGLAQTTASEGEER
jgi:aldehyde:ferredoxin oxidoreductase